MVKKNGSVPMEIPDVGHVFTKEVEDVRCTKPFAFKKVTWMDSSDIGIDSLAVCSPLVFAYFLDKI